MITFYLNTVLKTTQIGLYDSTRLQPQAQGHFNYTGQQAELLLKQCKNFLFEENCNWENINRIVSCVGPGGFTSCRIGLSAVNAIAFARNIPIAQLSIFDLYSSTPSFLHKESCICIPANPQESWVMFCGENAQFIQTTDLLKQLEAHKVSDVIGPISSDWIKDKGFSSSTVDNTLPFPNSKIIESLDFNTGISLKPWYFKDARITWSSKHHHLV